MKKEMKKVFCILMSALLLAGLSAYGNQAGAEEAAEEFQPALDTSAEAEIVVAGSYSNFESLEAIFDDFNEYYPNVSLSYVKLDDYNNTITTALNGNDAPDIFTANRWMNGRDEYSEVFAHAEDLSDPGLGFDISCIRPWLLNTQEDGTLPMVPVFASTYGMLVNDDLFEKEGLAVPKTYSELLSVCEQLKAEGYVSPIMGYIPSESGNSALSRLTAVLFYKTLADTDGALESANAMDASAGEYMRSGLERAKEIVDKGYIDLEECAKMEDDYDSVILRFFEGDVPMMVVNGDTVSGTAKRESQSDAFIANPFTYSFIAAPISEEGSYLLDDANIQFVVNKECDDLDMTNEFMRFLLTTEELNEIAEIKRLVTVTTDLSYDNVYSSLADIPGERILSSDGLGITDAVSKEYRAAIFKAVIEGSITVDEAISQYGSLAE